MLDPILGYRYFETLRLVATMPRNVELLCNFCMYFSNTVNPFIYAGMNPILEENSEKYSAVHKDAMLWVCLLE